MCQFSCTGRSRTSGHQMRKKGLNLLWFPTFITKGLRRPFITVILRYLLVTETIAYYDRIIFDVSISRDLEENYGILLTFDLSKLRYLSATTHRLTAQKTVNFIFIYRRTTARTQLQFTVYDLQEGIFTYLNVVIKFRCTLSSHFLK
jgi:hypothetical protein